MERAPRIRDARPNDAPRLRDLGIAGWETTYASFLRPENRHAYLSEPFWSVERLEAVIERADCTTLVGERTGEIIGFLTLEPHPSGAIELTRFYVDPAERGQGLGWTLWCSALDRLHASGARTVLVNVFGDNQNGRRFYERLGFVLIEETTTTVGDQTVSDVWYRLTLEPESVPS